VEPETEYLDAFLALATRDSIVRVGDGCRIWRAGPEREFELLAADHRDGSVRDAATARIGATLRWPQGAWLAQALSARTALNPPLLEEGTWSDLGLDRTDPVGDVLVIPVPALDCVVVATRDRINGRYFEGDRIRLEQIVARAAGHAGAMLEPAAAMHAGPKEAGYLELASIAIWAVDPRGITTYVNRAAAELIGLPAGLIEGVPISEFLAPGRNLTAYEQSEETDVPFLRADGSPGWACIRSRALNDQGAVIHTLYDITDRRQRAIELRVSLDVERSLAQLATFLLGDPEPEEIAQRVVDDVSKQFGVAVVPLATVSRDFRFGRILATSGDAQARAAVGGWRGREGPVQEPNRTALEANEVITVGDFARQPEMARTETVAATGAQSGVIVPTAAGRGCIAVLSHDRGGMLDAEREMLERIAEMLTTRWDQIAPDA